MSFTQDVKNRLVEKELYNGCCLYAFLAGFLSFACIVREEGGITLSVTIENESIAYAAARLVKQLFGADCHMSVSEISGRDGNKINSFYMVFENPQDILFNLGFMEGGHVHFKIMPDISTNDCCVAAFARGAFIGAGSIANPIKSYHIEFVTGRYQLSRDFVQICGRFDINLKITRRKSHYVIYSKDSETVCDVLALIGAHFAVTEIYNVKIEKEIRNNLNRVSNFEDANENKTIDAGLKQNEYIKKIERTIGLEALPFLLREVAVLRLENPHYSLIEIGKSLQSPIGKSGVNHRLRKIIEIAEGITE